MKAITIDIAIFDGDPVLLDPKQLAKYPDSCKGTLEVKYERLTTGILLAADAALNRRRELFQEAFDGSLKAGLNEGFAYARAVEIIQRTVKEMSYRTKSGDLIEVTTEMTNEAIADQSPGIVSAIASRIEYPAIPTPEEVQEQGEG